MGEPSGLPSMGSHRVGHDWSDLAAAAAEEYDDQNWSIHSNILAWRTPSLTEKPGRPQSTGSQRVGHDQSDHVYIYARLFFFFFYVAALPQWELRVKMAQLLYLWGPWQRQVCRNTDWLCHRSYGPIRVFFWASCSWWAEGLFGQSFFVALPIQALRGLSCLRSFSVVRHIRHIEGPSRLGSYFVDQCFRHLKGHPGWGPTL